MPMHGPQVASRRRAPAAISFASAPFSASISSTCREPGEITRLTFGWTCLPVEDRGDRHQVLVGGVGTASDRHLVELQARQAPPPGTTAVRAVGLRDHRLAARLRSISITSSYSASASAASALQLVSRCCARRKARVRSSLGKIEAGRPEFRAHVRDRRALGHRERRPPPRPPYSITRPTPPLTVSRRSSSRITSFALTQAGSVPVSGTSVTFGMAR